MRPPQIDMWLVGFLPVSAQNVRYLTFLTVFYKPTAPCVAMTETVSPISLFQALLFLFNIVVNASFFPGRGCGVFKSFKVLEKVPDGATKEDLECTIVKDEACCSRQTV